MGKHGPLRDLEWGLSNTVVQGAYSLRCANA